MIKVKIALDDEEITVLAETLMPAVPTIGSYLWLPGTPDAEQFLVTEVSYKINPETEIRLDGDIVRKEPQVSDEILILVQQVIQVSEEDHYYTYFSEEDKTSNGALV